MYMVASLSSNMPWEASKDTDPNFESNIIKRTSDYYFNDVLGNTLPIGEIGSFNLKT